MFNSTSGIQESAALIPAATLSKAVLIVREVKTSKKTGATYLDIELRLVGGNYEGRRVYDMIMNPFCPLASEGGKKMGILALTRICEAVGIFKVGDEASYGRYEGRGINHVINDIENQNVAVKLKVEKGEDGRADRNKVSEWLTPNPLSGGAHKSWVELHTGTPNPAARATAFTQNPVSQNGDTPAWLNGPGKDPF
jgi:hypothetical protein